MHGVIGSGPAGVACASALLERGLTVCLFDGGVQLEAARAERVAIMATQTAAQWSADDLSMIRDGTISSAGGVLLKRIYGSDFPYREADPQLGLTLSGVGVKASLASGGFSNVWGAAMLPYVDADLAGWPFAAERLASHYRATTDITGVSAVADDLAEWFPLHSDRPQTLELSSQASAMLGRLERHRERLRSAGIRFGRSRLAVTGSARENGRGCVHCGLCMYGCPRGLIYNSASTLDQLRQHARFTYRPGFVVDRVSETNATAVVGGRDRETGIASTVECDRVFLAAGAIPSTQILLRSMDAFNHPLRMLDSQYYLVPLMTATSNRGIRQERLHTLSQLFLEMRDAAISPYTMHLQLYTYSDLIGQAVRSAFGPLAGMLEGVARRLEGRLLVLQGYLHSAHSATIRIELRKTANGGDVLEVTGEPQPTTGRVVRRVVRKLMRHAGALGGIPLPPLVKITEPGRGFHTGGTLPMRAAPRAFECDVYGRPAGWERVHAVDATVLPSVPATTITFAVMANAHRIGWESAEL